MRNLHDLKSFHENALNEWNATALIMKEAMKDEKDTRQAFVEIVLALADMAKQDAKKRQNIVKAGGVLLHALSDGKWPKTPPPLPPDPPKKNDRWRGVRRALLTFLVIMLCAGSFAGGFALNIPKVISTLPSISTPAKPSNTPEELLQQLVEAVSRKDWQRILGLYHPNARKELRLDSIEYQVEDIAEAFEKGVMPRLRIEGIEQDTRSKLFTTIIVNEQQVEKKNIYLKQFENVWYIDRIDF